MVLSFVLFDSPQENIEKIKNSKDKQTMKSQDYVKEEAKSDYIRVRITHSLKVWLKKNNYSPTKIWNQAIANIKIMNGKQK